MTTKMRDMKNIMWSTMCAVPFGGEAISNRKKIRKAYACWKRKKYSEIQLLSEISVSHYPPVAVAGGVV